jgi:hypothetical protein
MRRMSYPAGRTQERMRRRLPTFGSSTARARTHATQHHPDHHHRRSIRTGAGLWPRRRALKLPALVGYLIAGVVIGPHTPGFVADLELSNQLAEIGVMLLMFGVGLHFSLDDLWKVRRIALPGAMVQILVATALGASAAHLWGWDLGAGWCSACRCRWPARWCCSGPWSIAASSTRSTGESPSAGWWSRTW